MERKKKNGDLLPTISGPKKNRFRNAMHSFRFTDRNEFIDESHSFNNLYVFHLRLVNLRQKNYHIDRKSIVCSPLM